MKIHHYVRAKLQMFFFSKIEANLRMKEKN